MILLFGRKKPKFKQNVFLRLSKHDQDKIEKYARENGYKEITTKIVDEAKSNLMSDTSFHKI